MANITRNKKQIFVSCIIIFLLLLFDGWYQLSHCENKSINTPTDIWLFELSVNVLPEIVEIHVKNLNSPMVLNENVVIEQWNDIKGKWIFAACPLWFCATKESVFKREIAAGEVSIVKWRKKLHRNCRQAKAGKYRVLIKERGGKLLAKPVEFVINDGHDLTTH